MARIRRVDKADLLYHVMNRGNRRAVIFGGTADYEAFLSLLGSAANRFGVRLLAYCLMPNHWHLVLWPTKDGAVSAYMRWLTGTHVRRYHRVHDLIGTGHLYQGRYTCVIVQGDAHLLTVLRYVEANPLRAGLVSRAQDWPWSSLGAIPETRAELIQPSPVALPCDYPVWVNEPAPGLSLLRDAIRRGSPFGTPRWTTEMAARHGLEFTLRHRGRPRTPAAGTRVPAGRGSGQRHSAHSSHRTRCRPSRPGESSTGAPGSKP